MLYTYAEWFIELTGDVQCSIGILDIILRQLFTIKLFSAGK